MDWLDSNINRVAIVGRCGSGKSTLAKQLSITLNLPLVHIDKLYWLPDWNERKKEEFIALHNKEALKRYWVMDGNNKSTFKLRFERADHIIIFDLPRYLCILRVLKRTILNLGKNREDMGEGCKERISWHYWNFLKYVWSFDKTSGKAIHETIKQLEIDAKYTILKSSKDVDFFVKTLKQKEQQ